MAEKIVVGPVGKGLRNNVIPTYIDNDSFPALINAYQWRGRVKRKRGTSFLCRLTRFFDSTSSAYTGTIINESFTISFDISGNANLLGPYTNATPISFSLQPNANIVPGNVTIIGTVTYTDPTKDGYLTPTGTGGPNTINYSTGAIFIPAQAEGTAIVSFNYTPDLPVMGLEDLILTSTQFPGTLAFDTTYSYNILTSFPYSSYDVSFYKNPPVPSAPLLPMPGYVPKTVWTPTTWNGQDYQQFWTTNYQGALWATNGINVPFLPNNNNGIGMQFSPITGITISAGGPPAIVVIATVNNLVIGDFVFINEVFLGTSTGMSGINFQTGYVIAASPTSITVEFPNATIAGAWVSGGIVQYLTNRSNPAVDCIRWYDGDPTNGGITPPSFIQGKGWVNFQPPLSQSNFSIADLPAAQYYLVGARMIVPFKDRLLFIGVVVQTSVAGAIPIYLQDTVVYSQNGTPYYTVSYTNNPDATKDTPTSPTNQYNSLLVPVNQTATPSAWFEDSTGFGGFQTAGLEQPIITVAPNEDVLIMGFSAVQTRFVYTGNDIVPFNFFLINSELGSASTFSAIVMDKGVMTKGARGYLATSQTGTERVDLQIPDQVFEVNLIENGNERLCAQRDYINEWLYWTYPTPDDQASSRYPNTTLQFNYRDGSYGVFYESYTTYGSFKKQTGFTWATVGFVYATWQLWNVPWNSGSSTALQPKVIAGNQQGFVVTRESDTNESVSLTIQNITQTTVTSPNHNLNQGDYIVISGVLGTIGPFVNGLIFSVGVVTTNTFMLNPSLLGTGTYFGGGLIQRMYVPFIQTKQFPVSWGLSKKTRIGAQQYLLTNTPNGQIQLQIYLSQDSEDPYNLEPIVPDPASTNNTLIYSTVLFTSPENAINTCNNIPLGVVGDGITLIYNFDYQTLFAIETSSYLVPGSVFIRVGNVATFTDNSIGGFTATGTGTATGSSVNYQLGIITIAFTSAPLAQVTFTNFNYYIPNIQNPIAEYQSNIWHRVNTSLLGDTVQLAFTMSDAQMRDPTFSNQFEEIEIHAFIIDVTESQSLA